MSTQGIGLETSKRLAAQGHTVIGIARNNAEKIFSHIKNEFVVRWDY